MDMQKRMEKVFDPCLTLERVRKGETWTCKVGQHNILRQVNDGSIFCPTSKLDIIAGRLGEFGYCLETIGEEVG